MKKKKYCIKFLILGMICILVTASIPIAIGEKAEPKSDGSEEAADVTSSETFHFSDCFIVVNGNCNTVTGPLIWIFGIYCPLLKRNFNILTNNGENESITVLVFGQGLQLGAYIGQEHISVDINSARGLLYWAGKSVSSPGNRIFLFCRVADIWITTYD